MSARTRWAAACLPVTSVLCSLLWIAWAHSARPSVSLTVLAVALGTHAATLLAARRGRATLPMTAALWLVAAAMAAAVLLPLHQSRDAFLYDLYGRSVAVHHVSPYVTAPADLDDPVVELVAERWQGQESLYGPSFVAFAAVVAQFAGTSELGVRLVWQLVAATAAFAAVVLVARRTRDPAAVVALGISPVLLLAVNDAHNDVLLGALLLVVVLLAERARFATAGGFAALALTVKLLAVVPLAGLALWLSARRGARAASRFVAPVLVAASVAYLLAGGPLALVPLRESAGDDSRFAVWQPLRNERLLELLQSGWPRTVALDTVRAEMSDWALWAMAAVLCVVLIRFRRAAMPAEACVACGLVVLILSTYVMPWYAAMLIPLAALVWHTRAAALLWVQGAFLTLAYAEGPGRDPTGAFGILLQRHSWWIGVAMALTLVVWVRPSAVRLPVVTLTRRRRVPQLS